MTQTTCRASTLAKLFDVTERWIQQLAQEGILVRGEKRGEYDLIGSVRGYIQHLQSRLAQRLAEDTTTLQKERKRLLSLQADKTQFELGILQNRWIERTEMQEFMMGYTEHFIQGLSSLPGRLAVGLLNQGNPAVIRQKIKAECDALQNHLVKQLDAWEKSYDENTAPKNLPFSDETAIEEILFEEDTE